MSGSPFGENQVMVMVQGDTRPILTRTLKTAADGTVTFAAGDTVKFRLVNKQTGQIVLNDVTATIADYTNGGVTYTWGSTDTSVAGIYDAQFKIVYSGGAVQRLIYPELLTIRPLDEGRVTGWLITLGQAKAYLGMRTSDYDAIVTDLLSSVSGFLTNYLGYSFVDSTYTHNGTTLKKLDGNGLPYMYLSGRPLTGVSSLAFDWETAPTITDTTYSFVWYSSGRIERKDGGVFPLGRQNIAITYRAGYTPYDGASAAYSTTMPWPIVQVALELMGRKVQEWERKGPQVQSITLPDGQQVNFTLNELSKEQKMMLAPYVKPRYAPPGCW